MGKPNIIVISDLHVGAGPLDDCDAELEEHLVAFLKEISSKDSPVELVINGDFLDFAQAPPWQGLELESESKEKFGKDRAALCFTQDQSCKKLEAVCKAHAPIFMALGDFLAAKTENTLVILPGNHDADFFWPDVRSMFDDEVCKVNPQIKSRLRFHLQQVYRPPDYPKAWIEHGHQYDPCNSFIVNGESRWSAERPPIFEDKQGQKRLYECVGTRFLIRFLNKLDSEYPFVDNVKPFSRFIKIFGMSSFIPGYGPLKASVIVWAMLRYLSITIAGRPRDLLSLEATGGRRPHQILSAWAKGMSDKEMTDFVEKLRAKGYDSIDRPITMYLDDAAKADQLFDFLAMNLDLLEGYSEGNKSYLGIDGSPGTLTLGSGFLVDETAALKKAAKLALEKDGLDTVIMGHTHESVNQQPPIVKYINTGSWTRYYRFGKNDQLQTWSMLQSHSYEDFPYELNYAEIVPNRGQATKMERFRAKLKDGE